MINWRNGKGGFVGGLKYFIKGVFQYAYSVTTETAVTPSVSMSSVNRIEFGPEPRNIEISYEDRTINFPPTSRTTKL